jgi:hypothetical protein
MYVRKPEAMEGLMHEAEFATFMADVTSSMLACVSVSCALLPTAY